MKFLYTYEPAHIGEVGGGEGGRRERGEGERGQMWKDICHRK